MNLSAFNRVHDSSEFKLKFNTTPEQRAAFQERLREKYPDLEVSYQEADDTDFYVSGDKVLASYDYTTTKFFYLPEVESLVKELVSDSQNTDQFKVWAEDHDIKCEGSVSACDPNCQVDYKVGDKVIFTNEFGVEFGPYDILCIEYDSKKPNNAAIYLNKSSYWAPVKVSSIRKA